MERLHLRSGIDQIGERIPLKHDVIEGEGPQVVEAVSDGRRRYANDFPIERVEPKFAEADSIGRRKEIANVATRNPGVDRETIDLPPEIHDALHQRQELTKRGLEVQGGQMRQLVIGRVWLRIAN